jgi:hypothetical protein
MRVLSILQSDILTPLQLIFSEIDMNSLIDIFSKKKKKTLYNKLNYEHYQENGK